MPNCVTTPTYVGGRARTSADHRRRWTAHQAKARRPPKLLRDEEVVGSSPVTPKEKYRLRAVGQLVYEVG